MADMYKFEKSSTGSSAKESSQGEATASTIDHDDLISIGKEVGVDDEQIDLAVHLLEKEQQTKDRESRLWLRFKAHSAVFVGINALCIVINMLTTGTDVLWSAYVFFGMGLFLLGHYVGLRFAPEFIQMAVDRTMQLATSKVQQVVEDDVNVSFTVADSSGLMESDGLLFVEEGELVIEHQTTDSVLGILKSGVKETTIELKDIVSAKLEPKFWSSELVLQGRSLKTFRNLPGNTGGILRLKIKKQSHTAALNLVDEICGQKKQAS